jgi:hypothetical protein
LKKSKGHKKEKMIQKKEENNAKKRHKIRKTNQDFPTEVSPTIIYLNKHS